MIIFDIDGTLSIVGDRLKCLKEDDLDGFYSRCGEDKVNNTIANLCSLLYQDNDIYYVTGRRESCRKDTIKWLNENHLPIESNGTKLFMRKNGDFRHDTIVKLELVEKFKDNIDMVFEGRNSMVKAWRRAGITCLQVAEGDF